MKKTISIISALILLLSAFSSPFGAVAKDDIESAEALIFGEEKVYHFSYGESEASPAAWLTFTPEKDGVYQFNFTNNYVGKLWVFYLRVYESKADSEKNENYIEPEGDCYFSGKDYAKINPHFYICSLKGGNTYYLNVYTLASDELKEIDVPATVVQHAHSFKDFFVKPYADDSGEYGKVCKTCGFEKDIHVFNKPAKTKLSVNRKGKSFKASWKKIKGVKGYQLQYSTSSKFTKKTTVSKTTSKTKLTVKKLKKGKKYYVRVRSWKVVKGHKVYSGWSNKKKV